MKKILYLIVGLVSFNCNPTQLNFKEISSVDLIQNGTTIKTLEVKNDSLKQLLNRAKVIREVGSVARFEWDYKLRLNTPDSKPETRILWLYSSKSGKLIRLTKVQTPLYQIPDVEKFNSMLGVKG